MGQGNGQLVIYNADQPGHKVGVLYDLGSKSIQLHPKFTRRDKWNLNFIPKQPEKPSISKGVFHFKVVEQNTPDRAMTSATAVATPDTTERKVGESQRKELKEDLQDFIKGCLSELKHLILFLSHTDVDHINYISAEMFPANLSVTAFLCGDWFRDSCDASKDGETSNVVKSVHQNGRYYELVLQY